MMFVIRVSSLQDSDWLMRNYSADPWYAQGYVSHLDLDRSSSASPASNSARQPRKEASGKGLAIIAMCMVQDRARAFFYI